MSQSPKTILWLSSTGTPGSFAEQVCPGEAAPLVPWDPPLTLTPLSPGYDTGLITPGPAI